MTTLQPTKKTETYIAESIDEAAELVKDAMRQSSFKFVSVDKIDFTFEGKDSFEVIIKHDRSIIC